MKKRLLSLMLCSCMLCGVLVGCGSGGTSDKTSSAYKDEILEDYVLFSITTNYYGGKKIEYFDENGYTEIVESYDDCENLIDLSVNRYEFEYDSDGNPIKAYDSNGDFKIAIEYGKKGNKEKELMYSGDEVYYEREYNEEGLLLKEVYRGDEVLSYEYDKDGNILEMVKYSENRNHSEYSTEMPETDGLMKMKYVYDEDGSLFRILIYDGYENLLKEVNSLFFPINSYFSSSEYGKDGIEMETILDDNENITSYTYYSIDGDILEECAFEYNDNGDIINLYRYDENGYCLAQGYCEHEYDENGNVTEIRCYENDELVKRLKCNVEYDSEGNLIHKSKYIPYRGNFGYARIDYGYDSEGNLFKEVVYEYDIPCYGYEFIFSEDNSLITYIEYTGDDYNKEYVYLKKGTDIESLLDVKEKEINEFKEAKAAKEKEEMIQAYISCIQEDIDSNEIFSRVYKMPKDIDGDGVPEIIYRGSYTDAGVGILSYYKGEVIDNNLEYGSICFVEGQNKVGLSYGRMGYYGNRIYYLKNGRLVIDADGEYEEYATGFEGQDIVREYAIDDKSVSEDEYEQFFDTEIYEVQGLSYGGEDDFKGEEMISYLKNL